MTEHAPEIFDRALYLARQARASGTEILENHMAAELGERLRDAYPEGLHGTVFPFRRVFAVATRALASSHDRA